MRWCFYFPLFWAYHPFFYFVIYSNYSVTLAAKYFDDQYYNNQYYGRVGGIPCLELNSLELEFLFLTNFTLFVPPQLYLQYYRELINHATNETNICDHCFTPDLDKNDPFELSESLKVDLTSPNAKDNVEEKAWLDLISFDFISRMKSRGFIFGFVRIL